MSASRKKHWFAEASSQLVAMAVEDVTPKSTKIETSFWVALLNSFCEEKGVGINLETCTVAELNDALSRFYAVSLRTKEGGVYKGSSYLSARAAIGRYVSKDINRLFNIFKTPELQASNRVLDGVIKKNRNDGVDI